MERHEYLMIRKFLPQSINLILSKNKILLKTELNHKNKKYLAHQLFMNVIKDHTSSSIEDDFHYLCLYPTFKQKANFEWNE